MLASLSSNAVSAKARGMHGKRLTNNNFMDLLNCKTVHDVAYYLKNRTSKKSLTTAPILVGMERRLENVFQTI